MRLKLKMFMTILLRIKKCLILYKVVGKIKDEMGHAAIKELAIQKSKIYLILVSDSEEYKKTNAVNENIVAKTSHKIYENVLLKKNVGDIQWIEFKVKIIELELIKSINCISFVSMTKFMLFMACATKDGNKFYLQLSKKTVFDK